MKRNTRSSLVWLLVLSLMISVSASAIALASRINYYTAVVDVKSMIPLVPESVTLEELQAAAAVRAARKARPEKMSSLLQDAARDARLRYSTASLTHTDAARPVRLNNPPVPTFSVSDDKTEWGTNTQVDIFKSSYTNGAGQITAASGNGDKIIAPGTENSYTFKLKNDYTIAMDYTVTVKAWFTPDDIEIPVICRLGRYDGAWIAGDETTWLTVPDFDGAEDSAVLDMGSYVTYTLDWQWPYTGDDAKDTALANLAAQEDLKLTIEITTLASPIAAGPMPPEDPVPTVPEPEIPPIIIHPEPEDPEDPDEPDDPIVIVPDPEDPDEPIVEPDEPEKPVVGEELPPKTGDESHPVLWISIAAASMILLLVLIFWQDKDKKDKNTEAKNREQSKQG